MLVIQAETELESFALKQWCKENVPEDEGVDVLNGKIAIISDEQAKYEV